MDTVRGWGNKDLASLLAFLSQMEFPKNWANDAKDIILKPNEGIWFPSGYLPLITALPCEGEKSVQKAALPNRVELTDGDEQNCFKSVFVQHADKAKTWMELQTPISQFLGIAQAGLNNLNNTWHKRQQQQQHQHQNQHQQQQPE